MAGFDYVFKTSRYGTKVLGGNAQFEIGNAILSRIPFVNTKEEKVFGEYVVVKSVSDYQNAMNNCYMVQKAILNNGLAIVNYHGYWQKC